MFVTETQLPTENHLTVLPARFTPLSDVPALKAFISVLNDSVYTINVIEIPVRIFLKKRSDSFSLIFGSFLPELM